MLTPEEKRDIQKAFYRVFNRGENYPGEAVKLYVATTEELELNRWYFYEYLENVFSDEMNELFKLNNKLDLLIDHETVDISAVEDDFVLDYRSGFVFRKLTESAVLRRADETL